MLPPMTSALSIIAAYAAKRWTLATLRTPEAAAVRQQKLLGRQLRRVAATVPFYAAHAERPLADWPIMDKTRALENFGALNAHGVSREAAWAAAEEGLRAGNGSGKIGALTVGTSSGTSGNRGLFLVSEHERCLWLGSILAKTLPDFPFRAHRVAVMLSTGNELYETTRRSSRLAFAFFDIRQGVAGHIAGLQTFRPDTLVAPPKALRALAEAGVGLPLQKIFAGGEVLDPLDADVVEAAFGARPRSIYQATEGFLGVACAHGRIHLNEDDMIFEREAVPGHPDRFVPIITDLRRTAQAMIRYRLNDILVPAGAPCPCGSPLLALERVEGRCDDTLKLPARTGGFVEIMPDAIRTAILDSDRTITDFRVRQTGAATVELAVKAVDRNAAFSKALNAVQSVLSAHEAGDVAIVPSNDFSVDFARKLRRISREPEAA
jgi:putative adenylate-forming enzyme